MTPRNGVRGGLAILVGLAVLSGGCLQDRYAKDKDRDDDPILGLPPKVPAKDRAVSSNMTYPSAPNRVTNADLASRSTGWSSEANGELRIGNAYPEARGNTPYGVNGPTGPSSPSTSSGARLQDPPGATGPGRDNRLTPTSFPPPANSTMTVQVNSFEQAQGLLARYGVRWQRLETTDDNEWKFACSIPNASNPNKARTYEATDRYGLVAMRKVLDQIARDQH